MEPQQDETTKFEHFFLYNKFEEAIDYYAQLLPSMPATLPSAVSIDSNYLFRFNAWCRFSLLLGRCGEPLKELEYLVDHFGEDLQKMLPAEYAESLHYLADIYFYLGYYPKTTDYIEKAIEVKKSAQYSSSSKEHEFRGRSHIVAGKGYWKNGDIYTALRHYIQALFHFNQAFDGDLNHYFVGRLVCLIGQTYIDFGDPKFALQLIEKSLEILKLTLPVRHHLFIGAAQNIKGKCYLYLNPEDNTLLTECEKILVTAGDNLKKALNDRPHRYSSSIVGNHAVRLWKLASKSVEKNQLYLQALAFFNEEVKMRNKAFEQVNHPTIATTYNNICELQIERGEYREAVSAAQEAIIAVVSGFTNPHPDANPELVPGKIDSMPILLHSLHLKSEALWKRAAGQDMESRQQIQMMALETIKTATRLCDIMRQQLSTEKDKLAFGGKARMVHELAIQILYQMRKANIGRDSAFLKSINEDIFQVMQGSKSVILFDAVKRANILRSEPAKPDGLRPSQIPGFEDIKKQIENLVINNDSIISQKRIETIDENLMKVRKTINTSFDKAFSTSEFIRNPYQSSGSSKEPSAEELNLTLKNLRERFTGGPPGMIISYLVNEGEGNIYVMLIGTDPDSFDFIALPIGDHPALELRRIKTVIHEVVKNLNDADSAGEDGLNANRKNRRLYEDLIFLYENLIRPLPLQGIHRLYIIADRELSLLPFEILTPRLEKNEDPVPFFKLDFLLREHQITYHQSVAILYRNHVYDDDEIQHDLNIGEPSTWGLNIERLLSVAVPGELKNGRFTSKNNDRNLEKGITKVAQILGSKKGPVAHQLLQGGNFHKDEIFSSLKKCGIAHFFVHTHVENHLNAAPSIVLSSFHTDNQKAVPKDALLIQDEIVQLNLGNNELKLVLLNTCRGGWGALDQMEGPFSLANAFLRAGARNIYYTLFQLDSYTARKLVEEFMDQLVNQHKNYAEALRNAKLKVLKNRKTSHPVFWAAPVFMGNQLSGLVRRIGR